MQSIQDILDKLNEHREFIRNKYGVVIIGIFGSFARGEQTEVSDVDILVEFERPIGLEYFELWDYLEKLLECKVDLVRKKILRDELKDAILRDVITL